MSWMKGYGAVKFLVLGVAACLARSAWVGGEQTLRGWQQTLSGVTVESGLPRICERRLVPCVSPIHSAL